MKRLILAFGITVVLCSALMAQRKVDTSASATADHSASVGSAIASGTHVSGQLQNSLDVQKAKVGDQVLLKTTNSVKQDGKVVIAKGSTLVGHVTDVERKAKGNAGSSVGVLFDHIQQGGNSMPINAMITSVIQANSAASIASMDDTSIMSSSSGQTSSSASAGSGSGGLLGGVTSTVGNVVGTTTQTLGNVTNTVGATAVNTTGSVAGSIRGLTISQSADASAQGGSTLSMGNGNLKLDKGTTFNLSVASSTSVGKN